MKHARDEQTFYALIFPYLPFSKVGLSSLPKEPQQQTLLLCAQCNANNHKIVLMSFQDAPTFWGDKKCTCTTCLSHAPYCLHVKAKSLVSASLFDCFQFMMHQNNGVKAAMVPTCLRSLSRDVLFSFLFFRKFWLPIELHSRWRSSPTAGGACQKYFTKYQDWRDATQCTAAPPWMANRSCVKWSHYIENENGEA